MLGLFSLLYRFLCCLLGSQIGEINYFFEYGAFTGFYIYFARTVKGHHFGFLWVCHQAYCRCPSSNSIERCLCLFDLFNPNSSSLPFIAFPSAWSSAMIKRYGARVSPCSTPARMSNNSVSPSHHHFALVSVFITSIALTSFSGISYARRILISLPRCIVSKAFLKSMKMIMAERFLFLMSSINRRRAKIWLVVVLPGLNPFWFILR